MLLYKFVEENILTVWVTQNEQGDRRNNGKDRINVLGYSGVSEVNQNRHQYNKDAAENVATRFSKALAFRYRQRTSSGLRRQLLLALLRLL